MRELNDPGDLAPHLSGARKTVVFFEMTNCPYCRPYNERFAELLAERSADLDFLRVKIDDPRSPL